MSARRLAAVALALGLSVPAWALDVAGVDYAPRVELGGQPLLLNGAGVRYKFVVKVYTAGLYLGAKAHTPQAVLDAPGPKRIQVAMLRDIDANELGKLLTRGMQDNSTRAEFAKSIAGTLEMADIFSRRKKLLAGDQFSVDWVPGKGTLIVVNGEQQGAPIAEPEFFRALARIWLGPNPPDAQLKDALLGKAPVPAANGAPSGL